MTDLILEGLVSGLIELAGWSRTKHPSHAWSPGKKLKLLFAGYNGMRNTGSDVRVNEMLRQIRHILGPEAVSLSVLTQNFELSRGYFGDAAQVLLPDVFPFFLFREVRKHDGVVACEGSMFKSKFANALTTMMIGSLGLASRQGKLSVGYGAEAGYMDPIIEKMCARYCKNSLIITRNEDSAAILQNYGIPTSLGTDTAWTFEPHPASYAKKELRRLGWDERMPLLLVCPINPFWWPVEASITKFALHRAFKAYDQSHYRTLYFHRSGAKVEKAFEQYLTSMAIGVDAFRKRRKTFIVAVGTEALDELACNRLSNKLGGVPVLTSNQYDMYQLVSILRAADMIISSRYHGIVTSMPALVPSAGVTMDERIRNLMQQRGQETLVMSVDDPDLQFKVTAALESLHKEREQIVESIGKVTVSNLKQMARMGVQFESEINRLFPAFQMGKRERGWEAYLPPLDPLLSQLVDKFETNVQLTSR